MTHSDIKFVPKGTLIIPLRLIWATKVQQYRKK
jgi:hypothetical protein